MDLNELRKGINEIDDEINELYRKRMNLCFQVAEYKIENKLPVFQSGREKDILNRMADECPDELKSGSQVLFQTLMDISKCKQYQKFFADKNHIEYKNLNLAGKHTVAVPGTNGSYSQFACQKLIKDCEIKFYEEFDEVFRAVEDGTTEYGVLPIANSTAGSVSATYELLKKHDCKICGTTKVKISHCLAVKKGTKLNEITRVYSHEQGLFQCSDFLDEHKFKTHRYANTALAACFIKDSEEKYGAICSETCAKELGLDILCYDIANATENYTRFILISKETLCSENADIISVSLALPHTQSALYRLLTKFSVAGLNLLMIESRPIANTDFDVVFYLDFQGKITSPDVAMLINELDEELSYFRFLGNYAEI